MSDFKVGDKVRFNKKYEGNEEKLINLLRSISRFWREEVREIIGLKNIRIYSIDKNNVLDICVEFTDYPFEGVITHFNLPSSCIEKIPEEESKPKFKVGDRVVYKDYLGKGKDRKGVVAWENAAIKIEFDDRSGLITDNFKKIKKLRKKKPVFKVGDRVIDDEGYKGEILNILSGVASVCLDNSILYKIYPYPICSLKKLRKKKTEFKVGDRVKIKDCGCARFFCQSYCPLCGAKGTIERDINCNGGLKIQLDIPLENFPKIRFVGLKDVKKVKRLVKKPKPVEEFKVGDYVEHPDYGKGKIHDLYEEDGQKWCHLQAEDDLLKDVLISRLKKIDKPEPKIDWTKPVCRKDRKWGIPEIVTILDSNSDGTLHRFPVVVKFKMSSIRDYIARYKHNGESINDSSEDLINVPESELPKEEKKFDPLKCLLVEYGLLLLKEGI